MPGTFSQLYVQIVFAVKGRQNLIQKSWKEELYKYMAGIIANKGQKTIIINGVENHVHIFVGLKASVSISDLVRDVKNNSTNFINEKKWVDGKFSWQEGFGAFSYSRSHIDRVYRYIQNQEEHHKVATFKEEYISFLKEYEIEFDEKYLFDWMEDS